MESNERMEEVTRENAIIIWQASRLSIGMKCEKAPEILKANGTVVGTLGNFSASIGKAKSKKTFNVSAIVAAALKNGTVLLYSAELPKDKRKILYVDTEQSPYHCLKVMERILRMAGLPTDRDSEHLEFLALRKYTPKERIAAVEQAIYNTPELGLVVIDGVTRNFAASLFRNIKYFTLRKLYLCRKWMQKRLQKTTTTGITLPNFDFLA